MNPSSSRLPLLPLFVTLLALALILGITTRSPAQATRPAAPPTPPAATTPPTYTLQAFWVYNSNPPDYVFVLNNIAYTDQPTLQTGMADLPANTTIKWTPISTVIGKEPFADADDLKAFQKFCDEHKLKLVIVPAN